MHISKTIFLSLALQWVIAQQHWDIEGRFRPLTGNPAQGF
jgi:hypothetical protein